MKGTLARNLSANAVQLIVNQLFGLGIFYMLSIGLDKHSFGQISLSLAILLAIFNVLSFGIDQMVVKKIAAGADVSSILSIYLFHVLAAGFLFYGLLLGGYFALGRADTLYGLLILIGAGKLMMFFSTPFKQAVNGLERFRLLAWMSVISNFVRCFGLILIGILHNLQLQSVVFIFIAGDTAELLCCIYLFSRSAKTKIAVRWNKTAYFHLLREALPQTGVVLVTSALARFDWIFIGFMVSAASLAEYSFAYKVFEISTLPLLAIAPLLVPRFTRLFSGQDIRTAELKILVRAEMIIAAFTVLVLNICWAPVIDWLTSGKYGLVNVKTIFILSLCLPFIYLNNFLWTIYFARGRLKMILRSFVVTFAVNVAGDVLLIPFFKNEGAAFAFLLASIIQTVYYLNKNDMAGLKNIWEPLLWCTLCAILSCLAGEFLVPLAWFTLPAAILLFIVLLAVAGQAKRSDLRTLKNLL